MEENLREKRFHSTSLCRSGDKKQANISCSVSDNQEGRETVKKHFGKSQKQNITSLAWWPKDPLTSSADSSDRGSISCKRKYIFCSCLGKKPISRVSCNYAPECFMYQEYLCREHPRRPSLGLFLSLHGRQTCRW